jgi:hypothetical protein
MKVLSAFGGTKKERIKLAKNGLKLALELAETAVKNFPIAEGVFASVNKIVDVLMVSRQRPVEVFRRPKRPVS